MYRSRSLDILLYLTILLLFSFWASIHVALCWALGQISVWRALLAFPLFPLAPIWGQRFAKLSSLWVLSFTAYGAVLLLGLF